MVDRVTINNSKSVEYDGWKELSAEVDGERIWYQVPADVETSLRAEPFIAAGLFEAMARGVPLEVEKGLPLSPALFEQLHEIQAVYRCWNADLSPVEITAELVEPMSEEGTVGCFYSAGVDSSHTLLRNFDEVNSLFFILGFDGDRTDKDWDHRIKSHKKFADQIGKRLITIKTNARIFSSERRINWCFSHGPCLTTIAPMLNFQKVLIPSSHTYEELFPWGSHPLTDPMWSTEVNKIVHDAAGFRRSEKMRELSTDQRLLDNLQVCWFSSTSNCGQCSKCLRTMLALHLLEAHSRNLPELDSKDKLQGLKPKDESGATFLLDVMILAKQQGDMEIYQRLKKLYRNYQISRVAPLLDQLLLNGLLKRLFRKLQKSCWVPDRVSLRTKNWWEI